MFFAVDPAVLGCHSRIAAALRLLKVKLNLE